MIVKIQSPLSFIRQKSATPPPYAIQLTSNPRDLFYTNQLIQGLIGSSRKRINTNNVNGQTQAYQRCPAVSGSINKIQEAGRNGKWAIVDKDEKPTGKSNAVAPLIAKPNCLQTWNDFISQLVAMKKIYGYALVLPLIPEGMGPNATASLWVCPNWLINDVKYTGNLFGQSDISGIIKYFKIGKTEITPDKVLIFKDTQVNCTTSDNSFVLPQSRLYPLSDPVSNICQSYEAKYTLIAKKGAIGILSNESKDAAGAAPLLPEDKKEVQDQFANQYGLSPDQSQVIISGVGLKWQSMTFPIKDLMLSEEIKEASLVVYEAFGIPKFLTPYGEGDTFNNQNTAEKSFYQRTVIPTIEEVAATLSAFFQLESQGLFLRVYFDHLEIFQKSKKEEAEGIGAYTTALDRPYLSGVITREEYRAILANAMPTGTPFDAETINGTTFYNQRVNQNEPQQ